MPDIRRPETGRPGFGGEDPSMEAILRADSFVDALAAGRPVAPQDAVDAELAALLGSWRDETRWPPATGLITESDAIAALNAGLGEKRSSPIRDRDRRNPPTSITPRRHRLGMSVIGAAAAAVLGIGGFGAVVAGAGPGDALYGLRTMLFGAPKQVRDDQVALAAKTEMQQVQELISQGDWQQAQAKLVSVSSQVASIGDEAQKQELLEQFNDLSAKVVERNPEATAPPGIIYTVPPSATELVPALAPPTSTTSATSAGDSATSSTSASATSGTTSGTPTSGSESSTSASPSTSASTSASPSTSAAQQSQQTTTPTSAAPVTTTAAPNSATSAAPSTSASPAQATSSASAAAATTTTTSAGARSATSAAPSTTTEPEVAEEAQTTAADQTTADQTTAAQTTAAETTADQTTAVETTAAQTTVVETAEQEAAVEITTTVEIPVPAGG